MGRLWYYTEDEYLRQHGVRGDFEPDEFGRFGNALGLQPGRVMTPAGPRYEKRLGQCAYAVRSSENAKLKGICATTYATQLTCPHPGDGVSERPCPLYHRGCYGESGKALLSVRELNENAACRTAEQVADEEARAIVDLARSHECPQPLRLHTVGDCPTPAAARIVGAACREYRDRTGAPVWSYSHAWNVRRADWGRGVAVLRSCQTVAECEEAIDDCFAPALLVERYEQTDPYWLKRGLLGVPCPGITHHDRGMSCPLCRMCFDDGSLLRQRRVILFTPHGSGKHLAARSACPGSCSVR